MNKPAGHCPLPPTRALLLVGVFLFAGPLFYSAQSTAQENEAKTSETADSKTTAPKTKQKSELEKKPQPAQKNKQLPKTEERTHFEPSESISKDLSVSFPIDI